MLRPTDHVGQEHNLDVGQEIVILRSGRNSRKDIEEAVNKETSKGLQIKREKIRSLNASNENPILSIYIRQSRIVELPIM